MKISLNIVLDALTPYQYVCTIEDNNSSYYSYAAHLPPVDKPMRDDYIYICTLAEAIDREALCPGYHYICIQQDENRHIHEDLNCILINDKLSLIELAELIQSCFTRLQEWNHKMKCAIHNGGGYKELMDLCEPILQNSVYVLDSSYKLLAYTTGIIDDDPQDIKLIELGYHPQESLDAMSKCGRFQVFRKNRGIIINTAGNPNKYCTMGKWFWHRDTALVHVVMICNHVEPSPSLINLFEILLENCNSVFHTQQGKGSNIGHAYDTLLKDMIFGDLTNTNIILERSKFLDIPMNGIFNTYVIVLRDNNSFPIGRLHEILVNLLIQSYVIQHEQSIIVLNKYNAKDHENCHEKNVEIITPILEKYDAVCGVSEIFTNFCDLSIAYQQSTRAVFIGGVLQKSEMTLKKSIKIAVVLKRPRNRHIYYFDDILIHYITIAARNYSPATYLNSPYIKAVNDLICSDERNGTNYAQILYVFLACERNASSAGKELNMHRNNILYHIPRIQEKIGLDLDDFRIRLNLMLAFHLAELDRANQIAKDLGIDILELPN